MTDFDGRNLENMLEEQGGKAPAPDLTGRILDRISKEANSSAPEQGSKGGDGEPSGAILSPHVFEPGPPQSVDMTDENQPPQDPETLMDIEPTAGPAPAPTQRPSNSRIPTQGNSRIPTQGQPRIPSSQVPAARTTPGTMAEEPSQSPVTGGKIMVGTKLGQIEINGVLGKGGMGQVFRGYHAALDIEVAIKVLPDELSRNEVVRQRFLREARLCIKLDHPNIVRVFNVDEWQGNLYLVLELIEGADAAGMLKDGGRFRYKRALEIGKAAAEALAYAHQQGLVHRDVKPHNILLGAQDGKIKLSDFGLARAASSASHLTMSGQIMGTPHYMSPEQAESKEVTDKSDVYSLGVTLYHMLTGETPFVGDTPISVAVQHIAKEILYPEMRFAAFPKELVAVLKRMTAKDAAKRCSAKQAAVWLQKLYSMAGDEDLVAEPGAMKSMAPVVAESEAFRMAAERRKANDARAREEAKSMVVMARTMQEAMAAPAKTMVEPQGAPQPVQPSASQSQMQPVGGGMGKVVFLLCVIILMGVAAAGYWFVWGPGAKQIPQNNSTVIGGDGSKTDGTRTDGTKTDGAKTDGTKTDGTKTDGAKTDGVKTDGGKTDGTSTDGGKTDGGKTDGTSTDGGKTDGGKTDGTSTDGGKTDGGKTDGTSTDGKLPTDGTTPPPDQDNPLVANKLTEAESAINSASTTSDLKKAKIALEAAGPSMGKASERQRLKFKELTALFEQQWALYSCTEGFETIEAALNVLRSDPEADIQLNTALDAKASIEKLKIPAEIESRVKERREELFPRVVAALDTRHDTLLRKAETAARDSKYEDAEGYFSKLCALHLDDKRKNAATARRESVLWEGRIFGTQEVINAKQFQDAKKRVADYKAQGVPDSQKDRFAALEKTLDAAIETELNGYLAAARAFADQGQYESARSSLAEAVKLPLGNSQLIKQGEARIYVDLSEPLAGAEVALNEKRLSDCANQLKAADGVVAGAGDKKIADEQTQKLAGLRTRLVEAVSTEFKDLMKSAAESVAKNEFQSAGQSVEKAGSLPLDETQRKELDDFKAGNAQKLRDYVKRLLDEVEDALNKKDFDRANKAISGLGQMPIAPEEQSRLEKLKQRFDQEAANRFLTAYDAAIAALKAKDFSMADAELAKMKALPVGDAFKDKVSEIETKLDASRTDAVKAKLSEATDLRNAKDYKKANTKIEEAFAIAKTDAQIRSCENERREWQGAVDDAFLDLLTAARKLRENNDFAGSEKLLDEAKGLPLSQPQLLKLSEAYDDNKAKRDNYIKEQLALLEDAVRRGDEKGGEEIAKRLAALPLSVSDQLKLRTLKESLSGETRDKRIKRMPAQLQKFASDRYLQSEQMFKTDESIECVAASPDGKVGAFGTRSGKVWFYNLRRGTLIGQSTGGRRIIKALAVSADGKWAACGNDDGNVVMFDLSGATVRALACQETQDDDITGLGFSTDSKILFVLVQNGNIARYNVSSQSKAGVQPTGISKPNALAVDPTGTFIAVGGNDGEIQVFDAKSLVAKRTKPMTLTNDDLVMSLSFSQDGKYLVAASMGEGVGMWETSRLTDKPTVSYKGLDEWVKGVGFSPNGSIVCGFDSEKRFVIWNRASGSENKRYEFEALKTAKRFEPKCGFVGPDGTLLMGTADGEFIHFSVKSPN